MAPVLANQAMTAAGGDVVPQAVQLPKIVPVKAVVDSLEIPLFGTARDRIRVEVAPYSKRADVHQLQGADSLAGCEERNVDYMQHLPPRMSFSPKVAKLVEDGGLSRIVLVHDEQPVVDNPPWTFLEFPVVQSLQKRIKTRHYLFKSLADGIDVASRHAGVGLGDRFTEKIDALVRANEIQRVFQQTRTLAPGQMDKWFRPLVLFRPPAPPRCRGFSRELRLPNCRYLSSPVGPGHLGKAWYIFLFLDRACELSRVQFKFLSVLAVRAFQSIQSLFECEPGAFVDAQADERVMPGICIRQLRSARSIEIKKIHEGKMEAREGFSPNVPKHSQATNQINLTQQPNSTAILPRVNAASSTRQNMHDIPILDLICLSLQSIHAVRLRFLQ